MFRPRSVVVPVDEISRAEIDEVDCESDDDVEMQNCPPILLNLNMSSVELPCKANCDCVVEEIINLPPAVVKVVVPIPNAPVKKELLVDVAMSEPIVSCDPVAISVVPRESETMIEPGANDVELVPPLATGSVPVTPVVRDICPVRLFSVRQLPAIAKHPVVML